MRCKIDCSRNASFPRLFGVSGTFGAGGMLRPIVNSNDRLKMLAAAVRYFSTNAADPAHFPHSPDAPGRQRHGEGGARVEFNRNQFFMVGVFVLFLGIQFRLVESATLNEKATRFLAARTGSAATTGALAILPTSSLPKKVIHPPQWLGWSLISVGAVCILHSLAMKRPGG
jgi:hypothetical protein